MEVKFRVFAELTLGYAALDKRSTVLGVKFDLQLGDNLDDSAYFEDDKLNLEGHKAVTNVLVTSLVSNIHAAHQFGFRDSAEHLRYIITELERGFVHQVEAGHEKL